MSMSVEEGKMVPVICSTKHQITVFGYAKDSDLEKDHIWLEKVKMIIYWSNDGKGLYDLAVNGPSQDCRISTQADQVYTKDVVEVIKVSKSSLKVWESA